MHEKFDGGALRRSRLAKPSFEEWLVFLAFLLPLLISFLGVWIASQPTPPPPPINITEKQYDEAFARWHSHGAKQYEEVVNDTGLRWKLTVHVNGEKEAIADAE